MKPCPYCQQAIQDAAIKCRYCQQWLVRGVQAQAIPIYVPSAMMRSPSGLAIASLVCGLVWMYGLGSIAALILGYLGLREIRRAPAQLSGRGMAIAGVVLGWLGVAALAGMIALFVYAVRQDQHPHSPQSQSTKTHSAENCSKKKEIQSAAGAEAAS